MRISGKRILKTRYIQTDAFVVAVEVEMVIPDDDPSEPCYEPATVKLLKDLQSRAEQGDIAWLRSHGKVYQAAA
jgi:hypothetical protein